MAFKAGRPAARCGGGRPSQTGASTQLVWRGHALCSPSPANLQSLPGSPLSSLWFFLCHQRPYPWRFSPHVGHPSHWGGRPAPWDSSATSQRGVGWLPTSPRALRR